ncbi:lysophospholipid acyltransferase family protein [SAR86 cluster bacterium]|nr:lysophospholipid acyltransferase family protein [SAR86 cluster bacterium]
MDYIDSKYFSYADPEDPILKKILIRSIEFLTGQPKLFKLYRRYQENPNLWKSFWDGCVDLLKLKISISNLDLEKIPSTGPAIVVANHPFGVLDGLVLSWLVSQKRNDFKLLVHSLLLRAPETKGNLLPIDFTGDKKALLTNLETRKKARKHISEGGCIIIFPSGTVSTTLKFYQKKAKAFDCEWKKFTSRLIKQTDPKIIPINFPGTNSLAFQIFSHISLVLRSSLLFFEIKRRINTEVEVFVGDSFKYSETGKDLSNDELADMLRTKTYLLDKEYSCPPPYGLDPD